MYKILVVEDHLYYKNLLDFDVNIFDVTYNGLRFYKSDLSKYDLVISFNFFSDLGNMIILKAKLQGVKTLLVNDGILEWSNMFNNKNVLNKNTPQFHPIMHDYFFCVGRTEALYFESLGQKTYNYIPIRMNNTKTIKRPEPKHDFLITTANTPYHNRKEKTLLIATLKKIKRDLDGLKLSYGFRVFDEFLIKELAITDNYITENFSDTIKNFKCLITTPSSIMVTAMELNIPVAQIIYRDCPIFVQSGWIISNLNLDSTFYSMLNQEKERMDFQKFQVQNYFNSNADILELVSAAPPKNIKKIDYDAKLYNMINSWYNFNFEFFARKIYLYLKNLTSLKK